MVLTSMDVVTGNLNVKYRLRKVVPVSGHNDPICANTLYLSSASPITVGRTLSEDVQVRLLSKNTPLMISRKHASIYLSAEDNKVYIEDHKVSVSSIVANVYSESFYFVFLIILVFVLVCQALLTVALKRLMQRRNGNFLLI